jgi:P27 family predicted phage terminase small subunit
LPTGGLKSDLIQRLLDADMELSLPEMPEVTWPDGTGWHPIAKQRWREMWASDVAGSWERNADMGRLARYIIDFDRWLKLSQLMVGRELVRGSRGQVRPNPLFNVLASLEGDLKAAEEKFGLTPLDRMRLGIEIGGAAAGLRDAAEILADQSMSPDEWSIPAGWDLQPGAER